MYITESELADRLALSVVTLRRWRLEGRGPQFRKFGRAVRYALADVERFEAAAARRSTSDPGPVEVTP